MKTKEELKAIREEVETVSGKLAELTDDELGEVTGGLRLKERFIPILLATTKGTPFIGDLRKIDENIDDGSSAD